jgi:hypothetical protein
LKKRFFIIKWLNDLLPFQSRMKKIGQASLAGCPEAGCPSESEDHAHLLRCTTGPRSEVFLDIYDALHTICEHHRIDPHLARVLKMLAAPYCADTAHFAVPPAYADLLQFQRDLHPDSIFMGCFSVAWVQLQHSYLQLNHYPRNTSQARTGIKAISAYFLNFVHTVWLLRNKALHGDDSTTKLLSYKHTQLLLEIQDLYDNEDNMLSADRALFTHPYEYWIDQPTTRLHTFLHRMRLTVKVSLAQAADMGTNFRSIDSYFSPLIPPALFDVILGLPHIPPEPD